MSRYRKFTTICCAAVFALGLAACGGGSDGGPTADQQAQIDQAADLRAEIAALRALLGLDPADNLEDSVEKLRDDLADLRQQQADDAMEKANEARVAEAKALKAAIDAARGAVTVIPTSIPAFDPDGDGAITDNTAAITLKKGASVGSLGSWSGTDYAGEAGTGNTKTTGMVRVYSNEGAAKSIAFGPGASGLTASGNGYTVDSSNNSNIKSDTLPSAGQTSLTGGDREFTGTFMGASGTYECTSTGDCVVNSAGIVTGTWVFTPAPGATLQQRDANYLQFGWWVRKDKDGPTHAGTFYRTNASLAIVSTTGAASLVGEATYAGSAAGKFAISDPLHPSSDHAGHFTADAELSADFAEAGSTLSGTIDNFRLNDGSTDPGWSVSLRESAAISNGEFAGPANGTAWSIGGAKAANSGSWEARMYDDKADDGNTVPDSVVGSFSSSIGTTHSMVGAFGAEKQ